MLVKTIAELNMAKTGTLYMLLEFIGNPITAMFIAVFVAYYVLGIRQNMGMATLLTHTENGFGSIANILLIIGAGGAFNAILKTSGLADSLAVILSNLHMHPILLAWLVALILHAAVGSATVAMMGATAIVAPMLPLYPASARRSSPLPSVPAPLAARSSPIPCSGWLNNTAARA
jgi:D-serine transporter